MSGIAIKDSKIYLDSLVIIGFKLYPKCQIFFDKTFTSIFGKNGVGKTTLLDAIQVGLIANQQYTKFNVTTLKDDRNLGDYMLGSAGYIVFNVKKELRGMKNFELSFGLRLIKNPDTKVDIKTFAIAYKNIAPDDFFKENNKLIDNLQELNREFLLKYPDINIEFFKTISEYHQYLYENGVLGVNISSKISDFSLLYRSISTGLLRQSKKIIKEILSLKDSSAKKIVKHLSDTMRQRVSVVRKIENIRKIKNEVWSLEEAAKTYYTKAYNFFCSKLNQLTVNLKSVENKISHNSTTISQINKRTEDINNELKKLNKEYEFIEKEIEKLLKNISDFERSYNAFEEYSDMLKQLLLLEKEYNKAINSREILQKDYKNLSVNLSDIIKKENELKELFYKLDADKEIRKRDYNELKKFNNALNKFLKQTNEQIKNFHEFNNLVNDWELIVKHIDELPFIKREYKLLLEKMELFNRAHLLKQQLLTSGIHFESREELIAVNNELKNKVFDIKQSILKTEDEIKEKNIEIDELLKGKIVLPDAFKNFKGKFLYKVFDEVSIAEGKKIEAVLGNLKYAAIIDDESRIKELAKGNQTLFFIENSKFNIEKYQTIKADKGYIVRETDSDFLRYEPEPKYPVIGEKSRKQRAETLMNIISDLESDLKNFHRELESINVNLNDINKLIHIFYAFDYRDIEKEVEQKRKYIEDIEDKSIVYNMVKNEFKIIVSLKHFFGRDDIKEEYEKLLERLEEIKKDIKQLLFDKEKTEKHLEETLEKKNTLDKKVHNIEMEINGLNRIKNKLESEFPKDVLEGNVDFSEIKILNREKEKFYIKKRELQNRIDKLKEERTAGSTKLDILSNEIRNLTFEKDNILSSLDKLFEDAKKLFSEEIKPVKHKNSESEYFGSKGVFEKELVNFLQKHNKEIPQTTNIMEIFKYAVTKVYPDFMSLTKLQEDLENLNNQLMSIENDIKKVIENFKAGIEENILNVKRKLRNINKDLENVRFGKIRKIRLKLNERPAYYKLQSIHQSGSILSLLESDGADFNEFIKELGKNLGYSRSQVTDEDILDYRNYFDIDVELFDEFGHKREKGLSNGENLGTNIVIVLSMLTRMSDESIKNKMLPIVLDEADRLDVESLNTIYEIAENWGLQLIVALPNIPSFNKGIHYHLISGNNGVVMPHVRFE